MRAAPVEILVADRFPALRMQLLSLLESLSEEEWALPTNAPLWRVKDVAAHLLGGDIGKLSRGRDSHRPPGPPVENLVELINGLNADWVRAAHRMSPRVLRELLAFTGPLVEEYFALLDPFALGEPVSWAGPEAAPVWLDLAREFTERWHHQQQIRDAAGRPPLYDPHFFAPVLDAFVRALPQTFREIAAPAGTVLRFEIAGEAGGVWFLRHGERWELLLEVDEPPSAEVAIPQDAAWRLFTKGLTAERARQLARVSGDERLASPVFRTIAVIA